MPSRNYTRYSQDAYGRSYLRELLAYNYQNSPRVAGKLRLQSNPCNLSRISTSILWMKQGAKGEIPPSHGEVTDAGNPPWGALSSEAYQRWRGKLAKGSANLGVTLGTWKQSSQMISDRMGKLGTLLDGAIERLETPQGRNALRARARERALRVKRLNDNFKNRRRQRVSEREVLANDVLEYEFGWKPFFGDIHSALTSACKALDSEFIGGRARVPEYAFYKKNAQVTITRTGFYSVSYATKVSVKNPNLALLNRLGLINPGTVIWDLIPWSFVVSMCSNVNTLINSLTDEVGYDVTDRAITYSYLISNQSLQTGANGASTSCKGLLRWKQRDLGVKPQLSLQLKLPDFSWETAAIAASLVMQKFQKLNKLISVAIR